MQSEIWKRGETSANQSATPPLGWPSIEDPVHRLEPLAVPVGRVTLILRRRLWVVIAVFLAGVSLTAFVVKGMAKRYTAEASILVEPQRTQVSDLQAISADAGDIGTVVRTQIDILRSPALAVNVVKALDLTANSEFRPSSGGLMSKITALRQKLGLKESAPTRQPTDDDMLDIAAGLLSTKVGFLNEAHSGVLRVDVTTQDPELSASIANEIARQFLDFKRQAKFTAMQRAHDWFQEQMGILSEQLRAAELDVEHYRQEHRLDEESPNDGDLGTRVPTINRQQLEAISRELVGVSRDRALKEGQLEQAQLALRGKVAVGTLPEVLVSPMIAQLQNQMAAVEGREAQLATSQGSNNPELVATQAQQRKLQLNLDREMANVANSLSTQVNVARLQEKALQNRLEQLRAAVSVENSAQVGLRALQTKARATRGIYESFLTRATQLANVAGIQEQDASLVSAARSPLGPSAPQVSRILIVAAGLSLVLGVAIACIVERLRGGFSLPEEVEATLGLPLIGLLPQVARRTLRSPTKGSAGVALTAALDRLRGQMRVLGDVRPKIVMVTSALPREGKSVFAAALARNAAAAGWRVLLIECDFGCPSLAAQFRIKQTAGLSDVLTGAMLGDDRDVISEPEPRLHLITAGHSKANSQEMLASERLKALLASLRRDYDLVLLDTPPVLPVADALVLAQQVDTTLLVVRWEKTSRGAAQDAVRLLRGSRARIMGAVMTRIDRRTAAMSGGRISYAFSRYDGHYVART
ncbi:MAG TPA: polysaccharide biosynthesis tyrosine autokinase [Rhodopila sp.]